VTAGQGLHPPPPPSCRLQRGVHMVDWWARFPPYMQSSYDLEFQPMVPMAYVGSNYDRWHTNESTVVTECAVSDARLARFAQEVVELLLVRARARLPSNHAPHARAVTQHDHVTRRSINW